MSCNTAKNIFLNGLQDSHFSVRVAAALNAEHYYDEEEIRALKRIPEIGKFNLFLDQLITAATRSMKKILRRIEKDLRDSKNPEVPFIW
jgi:hypothetical protein